jgi:hypothetical protein
MLLPLGLHMGHLYGFAPFLDGLGLPIMWALSLSWLALCWAAFFTRETDMGIALTKLDEKVRFVLIPALFAVSILAFMGQGPLAIETGSYWYPAKMFTYALMLVFGFTAVNRAIYGDLGMVPFHLMLTIGYAVIFFNTLKENRSPQG